MKIPLVSGLLDKLKPSSEENSTANSSRQVAQWSDDSLELSLGNLLTNQDSKSLGTVQAITLSDFRVSLSDMWERYEKNILLIAETTIDRALVKGQTVIRQDDETWLLVTPDLTPAEAEHFASAIASSIGEKLIGARFDANEDADPTPQTGLVDLSDAISSDGSLDREAIQKAVASARAAIADKIGRTKRENTRAKTPTTETKKKKDSPVTESKPHTVAAETGLKLSYWPCWAADSQSLDTFVCRPVGQDGLDPFKREDSNQVAFNAISVARACAVALNGMIKDGVRAKLVVPIPLAALLTPAQRQILQALSKLSEKHRFLYLRPEIVGVPHSVSTASLLTARDALRPLGRDIGVLTDLFDPNKAVLSASGMIIGCEVGERVTSPSNELMDALTRFKESVLKRSSYVLGLPNNSTVQHAVRLGFSEVGGPGLRQRLRTTPKNTTPLSTEDLLSDEGADLL